MSLDERSPLVEHVALREYEDIRAWTLEPPTGEWVETARVTEAEDAAQATAEREEREAELERSPWPRRFAAMRADRHADESRLWYPT
jgi:hypothetical protein